MLSGCHVHRRACSSLPGLYPQDAWAHQEGETSAVGAVHRGDDRRRCQRTVTPRCPRSGRGLACSPCKAFRPPLGGRAHQRPPGGDSEAVPLPLFQLKRLERILGLGIKAGGDRAWPQEVTRVMGTTSRFLLQRFISPVGATRSESAAASRGVNLAPETRGHSVQISNCKGKC